MSNESSIFDWIRFGVFSMSGENAFLFCLKILNKRKEDVTMEASIAIQVLPKVESTEETIRIVDEVIAYIASTGLHYQVGAFETSIEGEFDTLMEIIKQCQLIAIKSGASGVSSYIKIAYRPEGGVLGIEEKTKKHQH